MYELKRTWDNRGIVGAASAIVSNKHIAGKRRVCVQDGSGAEATRPILKCSDRYTFSKGGRRVV